jgi:hypothetical protein
MVREPQVEDPCCVVKANGTTVKKALMKIVETYNLYGLLAC